MRTLKQYAIDHGIKYRAAWNRYRAGKIPGAVQDECGRILIPEPRECRPEAAAIYARVSSSQNKSNLDSQAARLVEFTTAKGLPVKVIVKECASGLNDKRPKLLKLLARDDITHLVVEHKDRLTRFGFEFIERWLKEKNVKIIVVNEAETDKQDLMQDFVSLVTSFCARLYGLRRSKRRTEKIIEAASRDP
ncbi:MAG: IS607 family transposase [Pirellulaceae bacterium]|nr:MAG: IS607 family transposase [Pirellulaceae bacterium]